MTSSRGATCPGPPGSPSAPPRYTLTAFGDRIYARMGPADLDADGHGDGDGDGPGGGDAAELPGRRRSDDGRQAALEAPGRRRSPSPSARPTGLSRSVGFEGTPVADARSVYVALTDRREQTATYVACLDAETGNPRWVRHLGEAASDVDINMMGMGGDDRVVQRLRPPPPDPRRPDGLLPDEPGGRGGARRRDGRDSLGRHLSRGRSAAGWGRARNAT